MILFFYGTDSYRSFTKLRALKQKYVDASLGDTNLVTLDSRSTQPAALASQLLALPFLAKTRLVVLPELLSTGPTALQEKFGELLERIPATTVAVVYESGMPDRRSRLFKQLIKIAKCQEFAPLVGRSLEAWISSLLTPFQVEIVPAAREELLARTNGDSWALVTELTKLATALLDRSPGKRIIDRALLASLVQRTQTERVFTLTDALMSSDLNKMLTIVSKLINQGENEQQLIGLIASSLRALCLIRSALDAGKTSPHALCEATRLTPLILAKHRPAAEKTSLTTLASTLSRLAELDAATKRGIIEPGLGLDLFLIGQTNFRLLFPLF
jgi:DNA polymerase III delta subunit